MWRSIFARIGRCVCFGERLTAQKEKRAKVIVVKFLSNLRGEIIRRISYLFLNSVYFAMDLRVSLRENETSKDE